MRYSASAVFADTMIIKKWFLKNFNQKDHSDENIVSIIGSLPKERPYQGSLFFVGHYPQNLLLEQKMSASVSGTRPFGYSNDGTPETS